MNRSGRLSCIIGLGRLFGACIHINVMPRGGTIAVYTIKQVPVPRLIRRVKRRFVSLFTAGWRLYEAVRVSYKYHHGLNPKPGLRITTNYQSGLYMVERHSAANPLIYFSIFFARLKWQKVDGRTASILDRQHRNITAGVLTRPACFRGRLRQCHLIGNKDTS